MPADSPTGLELEIPDSFASPLQSTLSPSEVHRLTFRWSKVVGEAKRVTEGSMVRNAASLYGATIITSFLGFFYWLTAARLVPARSVGIAIAMQSAAQFLSLFCALGLTTLLISELSKDRTHARSMLATSAAIAGGTGLVVSAAMVFVLQRVSAVFHTGFANPIGVPIFILLSTLTTVLLVLDDGCIGLLRGDIQLRRNSTFAAVKLLCLPIFIELWPAHSGMEIVAAWVAGLAVSAVYVVARLWQVTQGQSSRLDFRGILEKRRLVAGHHTLYLSINAPSLLLPVLVTATLGPVDGAAYTASSFVIFFVAAVPIHLSTVLFAVAPGSEATLRHELRKTMRISLVVACLSAPFFVLFSSTILGIFGEKYVVAATAMTILGFTIYPVAIKVNCIAVLRVRDQLYRASVLVAFGACLEIALAVGGGVVDGVTGVAAGLLTATLVEALIFAPTVFGLLRATDTPMPVPELGADGSGRTESETYVAFANGEINEPLPMLNYSGVGWPLSTGGDGGIGGRN
jgi:O-antigen/teichoic acid export membrane protein